jgi:hypothetical protein
VLNRERAALLTYDAAPHSLVRARVGAVDAKDDPIEVCINSVEPSRLEETRTIRHQHGRQPALLGQCNQLAQARAERWLTTSKSDLVETCGGKLLNDNKRLLTRQMSARKNRLLDVWEHPAAKNLRSAS